MHSRESLTKGEKKNKEKKRGEKRGQFLFQMDQMEQVPPPVSSSFLFPHPYSSLHFPQSVGVEEEERRLFVALLETCYSFHPPVVVRVAGGWVRDKVRDFILMLFLVLLLCFHIPLWKTKEQNNLNHFSIPDFSL